MAEEKLKLHVEMAEKFNFASHQSAYPLLNELRVTNLFTEQYVEDVQVTLSADPDFLETKAWQIDRIAPDGSIPVRDRDIKIKGSYLKQLGEAVRGRVTIRAEQGGETLAEVSRPVDLLAFNEWGGAGYMPELLAAFSTPNDVVVDRILANAADVLHKAGKHHAIDGYQSGSRQRVFEIASAIYSAIAKMQLSYAVPPASFECNGQKIRLPGQIAEGGVATCLDTTLLFAAALEQADLNPVVVMPKEHALVGVWLQPSELSNIVIDDAETLRKHVQLRELILVETTQVTSRPVLSFSRATEAGAKSIVEDNDDTFQVAVDIRQARAHRILPLGLAVRQSELSERTPDVKHEVPFDAGSGGLADFDEGGAEETPETPEGRLERWQKKLLDLTARNPLLNHKSGKTSLRILCPDCGKLEDKLADGAKIAIQGIAKEGASQQDEQIHRQRTGESITDEYVLASLKNNRVLVDLVPKELDNRAISIYRKAQTSLQEGGANTLYLALGFLRWTRDDKADRKFRAPLILLPVTLERKSVRSGVKISAHDDEARFNTTLLHMLRNDYQIRIPLLEGNLPADDSGIDVEAVWTAVRKAVLEVPGFEVVEDVVLGHFSFAKYLMWKDLTDRTEALRENPIVRHLLDTPRETFPSDAEFVDKREIDREYQPADLLAPLPADASQMAAIASADRGKSFVLIGPPGTGKSQTIANIISHILGEGKTVLFVSEKTAALDVVHRRMESLGLGRFCLPIHSNKARKADVLKQLGSAWHVSRSLTSEGWQAKANKLCKLRDQLNLLVNHLHKQHRNGLTPHYAIGIKVRDAMLAKRIELSWPQTDQHSREDLAGLRELTEKLRLQATTVGEISNSPFGVIAHDDWKPQWEANMAQAARQLATAASNLQSATQAFCQSIEIVLSDRSLQRLEALAKLATVLGDSYRHQTAFALEQDAVDKIEALEAAVEHLRNYASAQSALSCAYEPMAWRHLDGADIACRWQQAQQTWWPKSFFNRWSIVREMRRNGAKGKPDPASDASVLTELRENGEAIDKLDEQLAGFKVWHAHETNPDAALSLQDLGRRLQVAAGGLADGIQDTATIREQIRTVLRDGNDLLAPEAAVGRAISKYHEALEEFNGACKKFDDGAGQSVNSAFGESGDALKAIHDMAETIAQRRAELDKWCAWRKRRNAAMDSGLGSLVKGIEDGSVPLDEITETFEAAYCAWWSERLLNEDEVLRVSTVEHMAAIEDFREIDEEFQKATGAYIAARLGGQLPSLANTERGSQWGVLQRELQKKKRHKPVRQLVQEIPEVLTTLAPCMMMSPLSIAQYLPADQSLFDVVIFDEASQITVWDAVGSLARGRQAIVVGDPKQMPPTNFFNRSDDDSDGMVDYGGDLESILDEMRAASIPELTLNLHYRSRKESLIAFSNSRYYDNELITFPAAVTQDRGVKLVRPDGCYERGKSQSNHGEAKAVVDEIVRRLTSGNSKVLEQSIGVVTFNSKQQSLIEDLLDNARSENPEIEWAFGADRVEPVFVKNLETVQGDERDVILFSVTYGPDKTGHVTMNFGPLNRDGGERRLNVALTRARSEMVVFSTLRPEKIDLSRTQAKAVADLKHFLEYAERGPAALGEAVHGSLGDFESPFEKAVAQALREKGWDVQPQIGVSAYRIDLGVVHPDEPGVYLAGVECDGAMYHSSATARERDKIRQGVLEGLGWTLFRVWSTDWWKNKADALFQLDQALQEHLAADREERQRIADLQAESDDQQEGIDGSILGASTDDDENNTGCETPIITVDNTEEADAGPREVTQVAKLPTATSGHIYRFADLKADPALQPEPERFYDTDYEQKLCAMIDLVVDMEGPIHGSVLVHRIARHHDFRRAGRQIRGLVINLAKTRRKCIKEDVGVFFWPKAEGQERQAPSRYIDRDEELRKPEYICSEELRAIDGVLALNRDPKAIAAKLGIARLSQQARQRIEKAVD